MSPTSTIGPKDREKLPDWAVSTVNQIEDLGFSNWTFNWEYRIPDVDVLKRLQIRDEGHIGQKAEVGKYAEAMKRGDKFPPGVMSQDGYIVDFNTRARAAIKLGWPTFPVVVIQEKWEDADSFAQQRFMMLGGAFNQGGPKGLSKPEVMHLIRVAAADPEKWNTEKIAYHLHVTRTVVQNVFATFKAESRAESLGVPFNGTVNPSTRTTLGQRSEKLADEPFREIVRLTQDAGLNSTDLADLCKRVIAVTTGDVDRMTLISDERIARAEQIKRFRASGKKVPPLSSRLRSCLEFLVAHQDEVSELCDGNPNTREGYLESAEIAAEVLANLVVAQREVNGS